MPASNIKGHRRCQVKKSDDQILFAQSGMRGADCSILPVRTHRSFIMTQGTVQLVAGILAVILIAIVILRRKGKKKTDDEF
jgi:hypothetical protein